MFPFYVKLDFQYTDELKKDKWEKEKQWNEHSRGKTVTIHS